MKLKLYYFFLTVYLIVAFTVIIFSVNFFDRVRSFTSKSPSMNPVIDAGSVIVVQKQPFYDEGDIISYYALIEGKEEIITHRILRLGGNVYVTKGDANSAVDREVVQPRLVIGRTVLIIPYLGHLITFVKGPVGAGITLFIAFLLTLAGLYKINFSDGSWNIRGLTP